MLLTARRKIPYLDLNGDDTPVDLPQMFHDRAVILDRGVDIDSGTLAARPVSTPGAPGVAGRQFIVTDQADSPRLDLDFGVGWVTVGPAPVDGAAAVPSLRTLGTGANQAAAGNDPRFVAGNASGDLSGTYPGPITVVSWNGQSKAAVVSSNAPQTHGSSHNPGGTDPVTGLTDASFAAANKDGTATLPSLRTLGTGGQQAMPGNTSNLTDSNFAAANKDGVAATPSLRTLGTGAQQAAAGADARFTHSELQAGVIGSGDAAVTAVSVSGSTGAVTFTIAVANPIWVKNAAGVIVPTGVAAVTPTINLPAAPASARYAVYGLEVDTTGALALVKGADTATVLNTPALVASNTPATTAGKLRIWDFAVFNNAGAFSLTGQIDRRPWARGANVSPAWTMSANNTGGFAQVSSGAVRLECSGVPMKFQMGPLVFQETSAPNINWNYALIIDGNTASPINCGTFSIDTTSGQSQKIGATLQAVFLPAAGSHLFAVYQNVTGGAGFSIQANPTATMLYEDLRVNANNGTA